MEKFHDPIFNRGNALIAFLFFCLDAFLWFQICSAKSFPIAHAYFLDVGQGDGELMVFKNGAKIMTDAGPDAKVLDSLAYALGPNDSYIDIAVISHPQLDHFNGYNFILDHYQIGAFVYNGRDDDPGVKEWPALLQKIRARHIPIMTLGGGDKIQYENNKIDFLSPNIDFDQSAELNDTGLVELVKTPGFRALLTADIGFNVEDFLLENHFDIRADILKVPHHGSKYSSGDVFLRAVNPRLAVIEVGAKNTYGHPSKEALARLASSTEAHILRTDQNGTIDAWVEDGTLKVRKEQ